VLSVATSVTPAGEAWQQGTAGTRRAARPAGAPVQGPALLHSPNALHNQPALHANPATSPVTRPPWWPQHAACAHLRRSCLRCVPSSTASARHLCLPPEGVGQQCRQVRPGKVQARTGAPVQAGGLRRSGSSATGAAAGHRCMERWRWHVSAACCCCHAAARAYQLRLPEGGCCC
jgi:hypothetical protein